MSTLNTQQQVDLALKSYADKNQECFNRNQKITAQDYAETMKGIMSQQVTMINQSQLDDAKKQEITSAIKLALTKQYVVDVAEANFEAALTAHVENNSNLTEEDVTAIAQGVLTQETQDISSISNDEKIKQELSQLVNDAIIKKYHNEIATIRNQSQAQTQQKAAPQEQKTTAVAQTDNTATKTQAGQTFAITPQQMTTFMNETPEYAKLLIELGIRPGEPLKEDKYKKVLGTFTLAKEMSQKEIGDFLDLSIKGGKQHAALVDRRKGRQNISNPFLSFLFEKPADYISVKWSDWRLDRGDQNALKSFEQRTRDKLIESLGGTGVKMAKTKRFFKSLGMGAIGIVTLLAVENSIFNRVLSDKIGLPEPKVILSNIFTPVKNKTLSTLGIEQSNTAETNKKVKTSNTTQESTTQAATQNTASSDDNAQNTPEEYDVAADPNVLKGPKQKVILEDFMDYKFVRGKLNDDLVARGSRKVFSNNNFKALGKGNVYTTLSLQFNKRSGELVIHSKDGPDYPIKMAVTQDGLNNGTIKAVKGSTTVSNLVFGDGSEKPTIFTDFVATVNNVEIKGSIATDPKTGKTEYVGPR